MQSGNNKLQQLSSVVAKAMLAGSTLVLTTSMAFAVRTTTYQASAYGAQVKVGSVVKLGPIATAEVPECSPTLATYTASATSANETGLLGTGAVSTVASSTLNNSMASSDVLGINILGGVITASEIKAVSTSTFEGGTTFTDSAAGSEFSGLKVLGLPVSVNVAPNTVINLPLIGSVTLNEQVSTVSTDMSSLTVNMIHERVTLGANAGTDIIISQAVSEVINHSGPAALGGYAYAPRLTVGPVTSGSLVLELIPCTGTGGVVKSDSTASVDIPGVLTTGAVTVTQEGNLSSSIATDQATSSVAGVNLLSGLLNVSAITGVATGNVTSGAFDFSGGSTLVGLTVEGFPAIKDNPPANTRINIPNLGTLYLNRVQTWPDKIRVAPIELEVTVANAFGLAVGADLTVGVVEAQLHSAAIP